MFNDGRISLSNFFYGTCTLCRSLDQLFLEHLPPSRLTLFFRALRQMYLMIRVNKRVKGMSYILGC